MDRLRCEWPAWASAALLQGSVALAQPATPVPAEQRLFAVEIRVGPKWDASKPPQEQRYFREHSTNLTRLRDAGQLVMGARYADKGLVLLLADNEAQPGR